MIKIKQNLLENSSIELFIPFWILKNGFANLEKGYN